MNLIRNNKSQAALQKAYDDAYQCSLQSIILETQNNPQAALRSWNDTLSSITQHISKLNANHTPKSTTEQSLMSSILDIERQCHDRISFLESRRYPSTSPYLTPNSYSNSSSTLTNSTASYHKKSQSEEYEFGRPSLTVQRKNLPSKSDPLLNLRQPPEQIPIQNHYRSYSSSYPVPVPTSYIPPVPPMPSIPSMPPVPSAPVSKLPLPPVPVPTMYNSSYSYTTPNNAPPTPPPPPTPPVPPPHRPSPSSSATLVPTSSTSSTSSLTSSTTTPTLRKTVAELPQTTPKTMMKTLRTSGKSGRINYSKPNTSSASAAATLAWSDRPNLRSFSSTTTTVLKSQPSLMDDPPLIDLTTEVIQPARSKSQPAVPRSLPIARQVKKPSTPPPVQPTVKRVQHQPQRVSPVPTKPTPQQTALKRSAASNTLSSTISNKPVVKAVPKPAPKPTPKASPKPALKPSAKPPPRIITAKVTPKPTTTSTRASTSKPTTPKPTESNLKPPAKPTTRNSPRSSPKPISVESSPEPESPNPLSEWEEMAKEKVKNIRGIDETAAHQILNEIVLKGDEVHWEDIAGLEQAKTSLKETVVYPFLRPDLFSGLREPARGMLLFGPPGTGKTMLARAVATESKSTFFSISASSLTSKFLGESEKLVRALFQMAKAFAPSIIFVDEIDSLLSTRSESGEHEASRRIKNEFLVQWSDLQHAAAGRDNGDDLERVLVLAATNIPWAIDEAARRRFVRRQYIPLPERETRCAHLRKLLSNQKHALTEKDFEQLIELTDGFSGSDMTSLAKDAAMGPLRSLGEALLTTPRDKIRPMGIQDFISSLNTIRPSVSKEGLKAFEDWAALYGSSGA